MVTCRADSSSVRVSNKINPWGLVLKKGLRRRIKLRRRRLASSLNLARNFLYDFRRFRDFASPSRQFDTEAQHKAFLVMLYHSLEKGLALRDCRPGFGQERAKQLLRSLDLYFSRYPESDEARASIKALQAYLDFHEDPESLDPALLQGLKRIVCDHSSKGDIPGGTRDLRGQDVLASAQKDLMDFFQSRHSVRQFAEKEVPEDSIRQAAIMAQCSPSVCNRQACRIHVFRKGGLSEEILDVQGGNRGFGDQADRIAVITVDLSCFLSVSERNQGWVDGGLFAMTFAWGLHSLGVGTCFLNWSAECEKDRRMRGLIELPPEESIITLMAIGSLPESFKVATSPRRKPETVLTFHEE